MQMHDRHDDNLVWQFSEKDAERISLGEASPNVEIDGGVQAGIKDDSVDGVLNGREETAIQLGLLHLIVHSGLDHFRLGIGMELDCLYASDA